MSLSTDTATPMNLAQRQIFLTRLRDANPNPKTELIYNNPFELLIAVLLSAQATDIGVNKATPRLFAAAPTPQAMLVLGIAGIEEYIRTIGLFHSKAKHIFATCQLLIEHHAGQVPANRAALEALPGVGRKTANVVLNTAFGWAVMAVDTHVFRVANRTGLAPAPTVLQVEAQLMKRIPTEFLHDAHHWLILHGRYTCKTRSPNCQACTVVDVCRFQRKHLSTAL
jgi:endonuclease III